MFCSAHLKSGLWRCVVPTGTARSGPTCGWGATRTASVWRRTLTESSWRWGSWRARTKERTKFWMNTASLSAPCSSLWKVRDRPDLQVISTALDWIKIKMFWWLTAPSSVNVRQLCLNSTGSCESSLNVCCHFRSCCSAVTHLFPPPSSTCTPVPTFTSLFYLIPVCLDPLLLFGRRFCLQGR